MYKRPKKSINNKLLTVTALSRERVVSFLCPLDKCDILHRLTCRGKTTGLSSEPESGHVIFVRGCLILTAVNSSSYEWLI